MTDFEKQVRHALIDRNMSMKDLAEALEISNSYLHDILKGKRNAEGKKEEIRTFLNLENA